LPIAQSILRRWPRPAAGVSIDAEIIIAAALLTAALIV